MNNRFRKVQAILLCSALALLIAGIAFGQVGIYPNRFAARREKSGAGVDTSVASALADSTPTAKVVADAKDDALVALGKKRFQAYKCYDCHGQNGEGTEDAPDLTHSKLTAEQVSKFLVKPSADAQNKGMPDIPLDSPDHKPLVAFVMSLRAK
jgi:mono/diheme cytochrome c family protein